MEKKGYSSKREMNNILRKGAVVGMTALMIWSGSPVTSALAASIANAGAITNGNGHTTAPTNHSDMTLTPTLKNVTAMYGVSYSRDYPYNTIYTKGALSFSNFKSLSDKKAILIDPFSAQAGTSYWNGNEMWGYLLVYVKVNDNYLLTDFGSSGLGNIYSTNYAGKDGINTDYYENLATYPNFINITNQAASQDKPYVAVMGWTKWGNDVGNLTSEVTAIAKKGSIAITNSLAEQTDVSVGKKVTIEVTVTPEKVASDGKEGQQADITTAAPEFTTLTVGGKKAELYNLVKNDDGTYTGKVDYALTRSDILNGKIAFYSAANLTYTANLQASYTNITTTSTVKATDNTAVPLKVKSSVELGDWTYDGTFHEDDVIASSGYDSSLVKSVAIAYTKADGTVLKEAPVDAGDYQITYTWTLVNNQKITAIDTFKILPRSVTVTSENLTKVYNGQPLTNGDTPVKVTGDGFVGTDLPTYKFTGSQTEIGTSENKFEVVLADHTLKSNYEIIYKFGTLSVTDVPKITIKVTPPADTVYNGEEQPQKPVVTDKDGKVLTEGVDYKLEYPEDVTNVGEKVVKVIPLGDYTGETTTSYQITKREVTVQSASKTEAYTGAALVAESCKPIEGSFVDGEEPTYTYLGSQTEVGESKNIFSYKFEPGSIGDNYSVKLVPGTLKVEPREIVINNEDKATNFKVEGLKDVKYNGSEQIQVPVITSPYGETLVEGEDYELSYSDDKTNAGTVTVTVTGKGNYTGSVDVSYRILPLEVTLASATKTWIYDGKDHSDEEITVTGDGFVDGEAPSYTGFPSVKGVTSEPVENEFTYTFADGVNADNYTIGVVNGKLAVTPCPIVVDSDDAEKNFTVEAPADVPYNGESQQQKPRVIAPDGTELVEGTDYDLVYPEDTTNAGAVEVKIVGKGNYSGEVATSYKITPLSATIAAKSFEKTYDGTPLEANDYTVEGILEKDMPTVTVEGSRTDVGQSESVVASVVFSPESLAGNYDIKLDKGTLTVNPVTGFQVTKPMDTVYNGESQKQKPVVKDGERTLVEGTDYVLEYQEDTTNAGTVKVVVKGIGNYSGDVTTSYEIQKRSVVLTSATKSWPYDGETHSNSEITVTGDGFVDGEAPTYAGFPTVQNVTEKPVENVFSYTFAQGVNEDNYAIEFVKGALTVAPRPIVVDGDDASKNFVVEGLEDVMYDGQEHAEEPVVKTPEGVVLVEGVDYELEYSDDKVNAGQVVVTIRGIGNYSGEAEVFYNITQRPVTVATATAEREYDGTALTDGKVEIGGEGFVEGDEPKIVVTGSQTAAGASDNTVEIEFASDEVADNYTIEVTEGRLTVTPRPIVVDPDGSEKGFVVEGLEDVDYNGEEQGLEPVVKTPEGVVLEKGVDYELEYSGDTTNAGTVTVTITGKGNYSGSVDVSYKINPLEVTIKSEGGEHEYDGQPFSVETVNVVAGAFLKGQNPTYSDFASVTDVTDEPVENTFIYTFPAGVEKSNYIVTVDWGKLTVYPAPDPEDPKGDETPKTLIVVAPPADVVYNGEPQPEKPVVTDADGNPLDLDDYTVTYPDNVTDAGVKEIVVTPKDDPDNPIKVTYTILKRVVTITSDSDEKEYDGTPLVDQDIVIGGDGFVEKDMPEIDVTGSQTEVGKSENTVVLTWNKGGKDNYEITVTCGTLTVLPATAPEEPKGDETPKMPIVVAPPADTVYNGEEQPQKPVVTDPDGNILEEGKDYTLEYPEDITNVGEKEVIVVPVDDPDNPVKVTYEIAKRPVSITSAPAEKFYDGEALMAPSVTVGLDGFVAGEEPSYEFTGSQTEVGESENTFTFAFPTGVNRDNYDVTYSNGILKVLPAETNPADENPGDEKPGIQIVVTPPADTMYNGEEQPQKPVVTDPDGNPLEEGKDYTLEYPDDITNVGEKEVIVVPVSDPDNPVKVTYEITKRPVSLTSDSAKKTYDGTPLTAEGVTVGLDGFVAGEEPGYVFTGSQINVGKSENGFTYSFPTGVNPDNYEVTVKNGTLEVVKAQLVIEPPADVVYNGEPQPEKPVVKDPEGNILEEGKDYTLEYPEDVTNVGEVPVKVVPIGDNYVGGETSYEITPDPSKRDTGEEPAPEPENKDFTAEAPKDVVYNGEPQEEKPVVKGPDGEILVEGKDYTLTYEGDTTNPGTVKVKIVGMGEYEGVVKTVEYQILKPAEETPAEPNATPKTGKTAMATKTAKTGGKLAKTADPYAVEAVAAAGGLGALLAAVGAKLRRRKNK